VAVIPCGKYLKEEVAFVPAVGMPAKGKNRTGKTSTESRMDFVRK
jgi:hypothetical protein